MSNQGGARVTDCTVSDNWARNVGGGVSNERVLTLANCTITDNRTGGNPGGGIYNSAELSADLAIVNSLVAFNRRDPPPEAHSVYPPGVGDDCSGSVTAYGNNLIRTTAGCGLSGADVLSDVDPKLGPLQDNGGATWTHALLDGSPAIDAGANRGYEYKDLSQAAGPITRATVRNRKLVKVVGTGAQLQHSLRTNPNPVEVVFAIGERTYRMAFGGETRFVPEKRYSGRHAPAASSRP